MKYHIFNETETGFIEADGENVHFSLGGKNFQTRPSYVQSVEKLQNLGLNKCSAKMSYYSLMGELQSVEFAINQNELLGLKKTLGK